jgi:hypothetical protein
MGAWGSGPFENDAAVDFLSEFEVAPVRVIKKLLRGLAELPDGESLDVDDGWAGWAACELVALALGRVGERAVPRPILALAARIGPKEELRNLAAHTLPRIAARETSEVAGLWHEGADGARFDALMAELRDRLGPASTARPRSRRKPAAPRPKPGTFVRIRLEDGSFAYGRVLADPFVAFYDERTVQPAADLDAIAAKPLRFTWAVIDLSAERWQDIGWRELEGEVAMPVVRFRQDILDYRKCVIFDSTGMEREVGPEACIGLRRHSVCLMQHMEGELTATLLGRPSIFRAPDSVRLS